MHRNFLSLALLSLLAIQANAENHAPALSPTSATVACQNDVSNFEKVVGVVRHSHGDKAANDLREKLLPSKEADEALSQSGQCGLARLLRAKKLV
ncbi:MAG: hypothetical protein H7Y28_14225 [Rhodoferax sp.]|nr:hypothetical protein [Rhodoferax sp.]